jgi:hypothetical protein
MSSINSITFNAGSGGTDGTYTTGDPIAATVDYTPDTASVVQQNFTLTSNVTDAAGNVTATSTAPFTVNVPQPNGDTVSGSDDGGRTWAAGAATPDGSGGEDVVLSTTA